MSMPEPAPRLETMLLTATGDSLCQKWNHYTTAVGTSGKNLSAAWGQRRKLNRLSCEDLLKLLMAASMASISRFIRETASE